MARWFRDRSPRHGIPSVSLRRLLPDARFVGCRDLEVSGCSADSRRIEPGEVFIAIRGPRHDGHEFVGRALERGAAAVVVERPCPGGGPLQVIVADARLAHARLCHALADLPSERLPVVAVAGAAGRTPTAHYLRAIFAAAGQRFGHIGALGWTDGRNDHPPGLAEPGCDALPGMLAAMVEGACLGAIVEVSPEALAHRTASALRLEAAILTDLPALPRPEPAAVEALRRDHARLVRQVAPGGWTLINADDAEAGLLGATNLATRLVTFGLDAPADVSARIERTDARGSRVRLRGLGATLDVALARPGRRNVLHALGAAAFGLVRDLDPGAIAAGLESVAHIPGHLEPVEAGQPFAVWIDRAGGAPELLAAIEAIRPFTSGRLLCVLSAPDAGVLPAGPARACEERVDQIILTADRASVCASDARLDEALAAFRRPGRVRVEVDRERAIEAALEIAEPGDAVLITGGRSRVLRILDDRPVACDDRVIAARHLGRLRPRPHRRSA